MISVMLLVLAMNAPTVHSADGDTVHLFGKVMNTSDTTMSGDGSPFSTTGLKLFSPIDMWINTVRNVMYVTEFNHHKVRAIPLDGTSPVFTLIGYSAPPQNGSTTGSFLTSLLLNPRFFSQGKKTYPTLYVGDGNHRILELALETSQSSAFCGTGTDGSDFNVDRIAAKMGIAHQMFVQVSRMYFVENNGNLLKAWLFTGGFVIRVKKVNFDNATNVGKGLVMYRGDGYLTRLSSYCVFKFNAVSAAWIIFLGVLGVSLEFLGVEEWSGK